MTNDFVEYWAAARLFVSGGNPYAPAELLKTQQSIGWGEPAALLMWNPPWALSFIWPLGLLNYDIAQFIWFLTHALIIFIGAQILWRIYGAAASETRGAAFAVLTFAPAYFVLLLGQIGPLIVLGLVGFLLALEKQRWSFVGVSLALVSLKPHLLYLFWLALLLWIIKQRRWRALIGMAVGVGAALVLPLVWNREIYFQYLQMYSAPGIVRPQDWATPSLGTALGALIGAQSIWLRAIPGIAGFLWLCWYWRSHSDQWRWPDEMPLLLLVSVTTASFVWTFDIVVLLPALIQSAVWLANWRARGPHQVVLFSYLAINTILLTGKIYLRNDLWYFWAAPAFLALYLLLRAGSRPRASTA
jgi:MFS family permease